MVTHHPNTQPPSEKDHLRHFGRQAALFLIPLLGVWLVLNLAIDRAIDSQYERKYAAILHPSPPADRIILGTSKAVRAINPLQLDAAPATPGHITYNFAYNGSNPLFYLHWYEYLFRDQYPRPDTVIYAVDWFMFDALRLRRRFEQDSEFFPAPIFRRALLDPALEAQTLLLNRYPLIKDKEAALLHLFPIARSEYDFDDMTHYSQGYVPRLGQTTAVEAALPLQHDPAQLDAFETLLDQLAADGLSVIFVHIPEHLAVITPEAAAVEQLHTLAAARGIPILDYNRELVSDFNFNQAYFLDAFHMSAAGSQIFSARLQADLGQLSAP